MFANSIQAKFVWPVSSVVIVITLLTTLTIAISENQSVHQFAADTAQEQIVTTTNLLTVADSIMMDRVKSSMKLLLERGALLGPARQGVATEVNGKNAPDIVLGEQSQANRFDLVDGVTAIQGGSATLFSKVGDDFVRISTNVKKDGKRAIGTILDPTGRAIKAIREGKPFYGQVDILGNPFITGYEPMHDADHKLIGIWYVGYKMDLKILQETIAKSRILKKGFIALQDNFGKARFHSDHLSNEQVQALIDGQTTGWVITRQNFAPWDFQVVAGYQEQEVSDIAKKSQMMMIGAGGGVCVILIVLLVWLSKALVVKPLRDAIVVANYIAEGDLTRPMEIQRTDEIGEMQTALSVMRDSLNELISHIYSNIKQTADLTNNLFATSNDVARDSERQSDSAAAVAAMVEELTTSIDQVAANANASLRLAQESGVIARQGATVAEDASHEMREIADSVTVAANRIRSLGEQSEKITAIVNTIKGIADQTNLLALNAAIEAARAGEQGRGFAVVADEVRKLAESTAKSTGEISAMVTAIQHETEYAIDAMRLGQERSEKGVKMAVQVGAAMRGIGESTGRVVEAVNNISEELRQQSASSSEIARNVENIAAISEKNSLAVKGVAQTTARLRESTALQQSAVARFTI